MPRIYTEQTQVYEDLTHANGASQPLACANYKVQKITVVVSGSYDGTLKLGQSDDHTADYSATADDTNRWSYCAILDTDQAGTVSGSNGIDFTQVPYNTDGVYTFEAQCDGAKSLGCITSGATAGTIKIYMTLYDEKGN